MPGAGGIVPFEVFNFSAAEKTDRMPATRSPVGKLRRRGETLNDLRISRFLENYEVRRSRYDRLSQCLLATMPAKANVVTQQPKGHAASPGSTTT